MFWKPLAECCAVTMALTKSSFGHCPSKVGRGQWATTSVPSSSQWRCGYAFHLPSAESCQRSWFSSVRKKWTNHQILGNQFGQNPRSWVAVNFMHIYAVEGVKYQSAGSSVLFVFTELVQKLLHQLPLNECLPCTRCSSYFLYELHSSLYGSILNWAVPSELWLKKYGI